MNGKTILLVDDDRVIFQILHFRLRRAGYEVVGSLDPSEAVALARATNPDLYILDINFPPEPGSHWDGFAMAQWMHHTNLGNRRPIIFITADKVEQHMHRAAELGAVAVFPKPLDIERLLATVSSHLESAPALV